MTNLRHVEQGALDRLLEWGGNKLLAQMVRLYLDNSMERLRQIESGLEANDLDAVERGSHSLKSSAANVGAMGVSHVAAAIEEAAEKADWDAIRARHAELVPALDAATHELNQVLQGLPE